MFEVVEPFNLSDVLEILKITGFFALVYSVGALARLRGKTWLNAEHLGGCAFRFWFF